LRKRLAREQSSCRRAFSVAVSLMRSAVAQAAGWRQWGRRGWYVRPGKALGCWHPVCAIVWWMEDARRGDSANPPLAGLADRSNDELLGLLDGVLLELERRLLRYARSGVEFIQMADEGLVLSVRSGARLRQALSAATHAASHLQVLGVGEWRPRSTNPGWSDDPRVTGQEGDPGGE